MKTDTTETITLELESPFCLKSGGQLEHIELAYESYGKLNPSGDNAILVCHALTMNAHVSNNNNSEVEPGWWNYFVGPGYAVDTNKFFVICFNVLGGCKGSTGPLSEKPDGSGVYSSDFPVVTVEDMVQTQKIALNQMSVTQLYAVVGGSLGGMQALEWAVSYPEMVQRTIAIATGARLSPQGLAFDIIARKSIMLDSEWNGGKYNAKENKPMAGLGLARMIGHVTYISKQTMEQKFGRDMQSGSQEKNFSTKFKVESFLKYQGEKFVKRFDANTYLYISRAMDLFDLGEKEKSLAPKLKKSLCRWLIICFSSDWLFPAEDSIEIASTLVREGRNVTYVSIDTDLGHDAFLIDRPEVKAQQDLVSSFLEADV